MSSSLQLQILRCASVATVTVVGYDYILTLSREINYVWRRPWTLVSTMFVLARYLGLFLVIAHGFLINSFIAVPEGVSVSIPVFSLENIRMRYGHLEGIGIYQASNWASVVFFAASELVMILRVYAMWNRSRIIIGVLLSISMSEIIYNVVVNIEYPAAGSCQFLGGIFATNVLSALIASFLGFVLFILASVQTLRQSIKMYKATKQWQLNRYIQLFLQDGLLFLTLSAVILIAMMKSAVLSGTSADMVLVAILQCLGYLYYGPFIPHLVISVRELYDQELHWKGIDTGFGVLSQPTASRNMAISTIAFADVLLNQDPTVAENTDGSEHQDNLT